MVVTFYETARGDRPVEEFIDDLSAKEAAKVLDAGGDRGARLGGRDHSADQGQALGAQGVSDSHFLRARDRPGGGAAARVQEAGPEGAAEGDRDCRAADGGSARGTTVGAEGTPRGSTESKMAARKRKTI